MPTVSRSSASRSMEHAANVSPQQTSLLFLVRYYRETLNAYERFDYANGSRAQMLAMAQEASALRRIILDYIEEGYTALAHELVEKSDALDRLQAVLHMALQQAGGGTERDHFYLCPEAVRLDALATDCFDGGELFELTEYLHRLDCRSARPGALAPYFDSTEQMRRWLQQSEVLMGEMVDFLLWIQGHLRRQPTLVPVTLLRDTSLIYLGLVWLHRLGLLALAPRPLFLSRKFAASLPDSEKSYVTLVSEVLYRILWTQAPTDLATLRREFVAQAHAHPDIGEPFARASRAYLETLALETPPFLIETGWHGTFPLWVLSLTDNHGEFLLYSTSPWLYPFYRDIVFTSNGNNLRALETIVLHDKLFQFDRYTDGQVMVRETCSEAVRNLAFCELHLFKQIFEQRVCACRQ